MIKGLLLGFIPEKDTSHEIKTNYANSRKNECTFMNYNNKKKGFWRQHTAKQPYEMSEASV